MAMKLTKAGTSISQTGSGRYNAPRSIGISGGSRYEPHDTADSAAKLAKLFRDSRREIQLGLTGQQAIRARYHAELSPSRL
jgi:hypothetical protein